MKPPFDETRFADLLAEVKTPRSLLYLYPARPEPRRQRVFAMVSARAGIGFIAATALTGTAVAGVLLARNLPWHQAPSARIAVVTPTATVPAAPANGDGTAAGGPPFATEPPVPTPGLTPDPTTPGGTAPPPTNTTPPTNAPLPPATAPPAGGPGAPPAPTPMPTPVPTPIPTPVPTPVPTPLPQPGTSTFLPSNDSWVDQARPQTNFGSSPTLSAASNPALHHTYLQFNVSGTVGTVQTVKLRIYVVSGGGGFTVHHVASNNWTDSGITYANAPAYDSSGVTVNNPPSGAWQLIDVTSATQVSGNGTYSLALTSASANTLDSADAGAAWAPQLIVTTT